MSDALHILYVDDDPDIRAIAKMAMELDPGISVCAVGSGSEALAQLRSGTWRPDAILLDVMMPGMDGMTLAGEIRQMVGLGAVPLIFMTARAREGDLARYRSIGAVSVIVKPFDPIALAADVRAAIGT